MKRNTILVAAVALLALAFAGCATKEYVQGEVATVTTRVDGVETQVETAQTQIKDHDSRLQQNASATQAASKTAQEALDRAMAAGKLAEGKFLYETVLSDDKVRFGFNEAELSAEAKAALDAFAAQIKEQNKNVFIEIQGHTDSIGDEEYNARLGEKRAEGVRRYLSLQHGMALHRMSVISYGESAPVADNGNREGRTQNRRVVLVVLQ